MAEKLVIKNIEDMTNNLKKELSSEYLEVTQDFILKFADATLDHQWIHTDPERVKKEKPFGLETTIAHGYLLVSLIPYFLWQVIEFPTVKMFVNYGMDNLLFKNPVKNGSKLRARTSIKEIKDLRRVIRVTISVILEVEGEEKPSATADVIFLLQF